MKAVRIYQPENYIPGNTYALNEVATQHVGVVLRMRAGERLILFNGNNQEYTAEILEVQKKSVRVYIQSVQMQSRESPRAIHLAQALAKGDKMEWIVQKAVELGVASVQPLLTEHCAIKMDNDRLLKKRAQWQAIAIAACEQSGRNKIPEILTPLTLQDYLAKETAALKFILHPEGGMRWQAYDLKSGEIAIIIGPEGGFSANECQQARAADFKSLCLGPRILRTETAGIAALSLLQGIVGDL